LPHAEYLTASQKDRLASVAISQRFEKGKEICKEGELAASMYILKSGKLTKHKGNEFKGTITRGESFEEYTSLSKGCLRRTTIRVADDAEVMALGVEDIENALGRSLPLIILRNEAMTTLKSTKLLERLSAEYLEKIIDCFKLKNVKPGEMVTRKDDECRKLIFFVAEGQYMISDSSKRAKLYGEGAFVDSAATFRCEIRMKEQGKIAWTTLEEVVRAFGCTLNEAFKNSEAISKALETQKHNKITLAEMGKKLSLEDIRVVKKLGEGQFGHVFLVTDEAKQQFFALKSVSKL
jgi:CRP-like cAMP-binding protein